MQGNNNIETQQPISSVDPIKSGNKSFPVTAVLAIVAVLGIGFGVYGMFFKPVEKEVATSRISEIDESKKGLDEIANSESSTEQVFIAETSVATSSEDYIYVGEYGIKIKKPANWKERIERYEYINSWPHAVPTFDIKERFDGDDDFATIAIFPGNCIKDSSVVSKEIVIGDTSLCVFINNSVSNDFQNFFLDENNYSKF